MKQNPTRDVAQKVGSKTRQSQGEAAGIRSAGPADTRKGSVQGALIVGLNNPLSSSPEDALVPWPDGCTGARLYDLIRESAPKVTEEHYLSAFARMNLWPGAELPKGPGRANALRAQGRKVLRGIIDSGYRTVVLLGPLVWTNVLETTETPEWFSARKHYGRLFYYVPHPSGRNLLYNNPNVRRRASSLLAQIAMEALAA